MSEDKAQIEEIQKSEGKDAQRRYVAIANRGMTIIGQTALSEEKSFSESDVVAAKKFMIEAAPYAHPKVFPSYWEHLLLSSLYGKAIAEKTHGPEFTPNEVEALMFFHDLGRLVTPHRFWRDTIIENRLAQRIGIRQYLMKKLPQLRPIPQFSDTTEAQRISDVADNISKRNQDGTLLTVEQTVNYNQGRVVTYRETVWPSEKAYPISKDLIDSANFLFAEEIEWLKKEFGIDFDELRKKVLEEFNNPENQRWLSQVMNAQETLDPNVDKELERPSIRTIVMDFGGVLVENPDPEFFKRIGEKLNCSAEDVSKIVSDLSDKAMTGEVSEEEFFRDFFSKLSIPYPGFEEAKNIFTNPDIYRPIPIQGIKEIIDVLSKNKDIELYVLSDAIAPLAGVVYDTIKSLFPEISAQNIFISSQIGASKRERGGPAFTKLLENLGSPNPWTILLIDDNPRYTTEARAFHNLRSITFRGNDKLSPIERLKEELKKSSLI